MAQNYTRQSSFDDGDTITASLFNNEFNQIVNALAYSASSDSSTGHKHDGNSGQGGNIPQIGDIDFLNKIVVDGTNNRWGFFVQVGGVSVEQIRVQDGAIVPVTDSDIDLGTSSLEFKDLFLDGTAHIDTLDVDANATVAGTLGVTGNTTVGGTLGVTGVLTGTSLDISGNVDIDGVTNLDVVDIDGAVDMASTLTVTGVLTGTSLDISGNVDVDGVTNLDVVDIDGAVNMATTLIVTGNVDFDGDLDVDGTTNLDVVDIDGAVNMATTLAVEGNVDFNGDLDVDGTIEFDAISGTGAVTVTNILDEDDMSSDSATALATQQSIKAYVDAQQDTVDTFGEVLALGNTTEGTDISVSTDDKVQFRDAAIYINSSVDGQLDIVADTEIQIAATTIDIDGAVQADGTVTVGVDDTGYDVKFFGATTGKSLLWDESADSLIVTGTTTMTGNSTVSGTLGVTGVLTGTSLDISGDIDVDGTTNLDVVDIDGAVDMASTLTVASNIVVGGTVDGRDVATDGTKLDGIEASADVTDTANVTAAGALMDSELTAIASVKALNQGVATGDSPQFVGITSTANVIVGGNLTVNGTTTTLNTATLDVEDKNITVNYGAGDTTGSANGAGLTIQDAVDASTDATILWDTTNDEFDFSHPINVTGAITASGEITANGGIALGDSDKATFGAGDDLEIYHNGSHSFLSNTTGNMYIQDDGYIEIGSQSGEVYIGAAKDGAVNLRYDNVAKLATTSTGIDVTGTVTATGTSVFASLDISGDIDVDGTTNLDVVDIDGAVDMASTLQVDGAATFTTEITANGGIALGDNNKATFGAGDDLQIYHDGSASYIDEQGTGDLRIRGTSMSLKTSDNETYALFAANGASAIYYDNAEKLATTATGIDVTGRTKATYFNATSTAVTATSGNAYLVRSPSNGAVVYGYGTSRDATLGNRSGAVALGVVANTTNVSAYGDFVVAGNLATGGDVTIENATPILDINYTGTSGRIDFNNSSDAVKSRIIYSEGTGLSIGANGTEAAIKIADGTNDVSVKGDLLVDAANAEVNLKAGVGGTSGAVNWTFNTTGTDFASIKFPYDTRNTTGLHIDAGYPITIDATTEIKFAVSGNNVGTWNSSGLDVTGIADANYFTSVNSAWPGSPAAGEARLIGLAADGAVISGSGSGHDVLVTNKNGAHALRVPTGTQNVEIKGALIVDGLFRYATISEVTIASGAVTVTQNVHYIDTEGNASTDDLNTINGGVEGMTLICRVAVGGRATVFKNGTGNIFMGDGADVTISTTADNIMLAYFAGAWQVIASLV